jgi:hypothetical protein
VALKYQQQRWHKILFMSLTIDSLCCSVFPRRYMEGLLSLKMELKRPISTDKESAGAGQQDGK